MKFLLKLGKGKLTYAIALLTLAWAVAGWQLGLLAPELALDHALAALGLAGLRRAVK